MLYKISDFINCL